MDGVGPDSRSAQRRRRHPGGLLVAGLLAATMLAGPPASAQTARHDPPAGLPAEPARPAWPDGPAAPKGAPNILVIMTDDVGFGAASTFGGPVPTPTLDALARSGARYNDFHTAGVCSPTRAALLTGRNPHAVGMGTVTNVPSGHPGYTTAIPASAGTVAAILKANGYNTAMVGKGHITPEWEMSQAGPFDRWPTGLGFEYFYGFLSADASAYEPDLVENTRHVSRPPGDYQFERDIADRAIAWLTAQRAAAPSRPFFLYYATGAAHAPHHAPSEWLEKFRGKFDEGWDAARASTVARQKALGVIPAGATDAPRPEGLPHWESLTQDQKRLYARYMEAYAAQLAYADAQIGRVIETLRRDGTLANTMIVFIQGDNGAPEEGGPEGYLFDTSSLSGVNEDMAARIARIDAIGSRESLPLIPAGWGWALNAPFPWAKRYASHLGATRNGMVVSWPGHIDDAQTVRSQFHHVRDILPTILDVVGVAAPATLGGVPQQPITGISLKYTFTEPHAAGRRDEQIFGAGDNVAIYKDHWVAATTPQRSVWDTRRPPVPFDQRKWELYDLSRDFSEARDLSGTNPAKLAELQRLFRERAGPERLLPIQSGFDMSGRPDLRNGRTSFRYLSPVANVPESAAPSPIGTSFSIDAQIIVPADGGQGVLAAQGGRHAGYSFFLDRGRPTFSYLLSPLQGYRIAASSTLAPGAHRVVADFRSDRPEPGSGGQLTLRIDGKLVAEGRIAATFPMLISYMEGFDVGEDAVSPVDPAYTSESSRFTGTIQEIDFRLE